MRRGYFTHALAITLGLFVASVATAQDRIALVIGNGAYSSVQSLDNPPKDASLIAEALTNVGFEVTQLLDADQATMLRAIGQFGRDLRSRGPETTGLFYYAGHGVQSFGENYILPVNISLTDAADLPLVGVEAQAILRQMFSARNRTNIVILDACRDNPFERILDMGDNGLAEMKAPTGTFLAYSTSPGEVALDGIGDNSPFTTALARQISVPGEPIEQAFKSVRVEVLRLSNGRQVPWDTSSLTSDFAFTPAVEENQDEAAAAALWALVRDSGDPVQLQLFLRAHSDSPFADEAQEMMSRFDVADETVASTREPTLSESVPVASEQEMIAQASLTGTRADYQAYLDQYPTGTYAELAAFEIAAMDRAAAAAAPAAATAPVVAAPPKVVAVTYDAPLAQGGPDIAGRSLEQLITGSPLFPPIDGLPETVWKGKTCSNCHDWQRDALCTQARTYTTANAERSLAKQHPYGGGFKSNLLRWAQNDCR